jgi:oxaloacetate decarboxylase alpha subunit
MLAAGPARRHYNPEAEPLLNLLRGLRDRSPVSELVVSKPGLRIELRQRAGGRGR